MNYKLLLTLVFLMVYSHAIVGQRIGPNLSTFRISAGLGDLSFRNLCLEYRFDNTELRLGLGSYKFGNRNSLSIPVSISYYFGINSKYQNPWFAKLTIVNSKNVYKRTRETKQGTIDLKIGREINFSKRWGLSLDLGLSKLLYYKVNFQIRDHYHESLTGSIKIYYRFYYRNSRL